ncbi:MAG: hypothetical protein R2757_17260 [Draconibacterium sp.]|jgi:predicted Fe-Mo cluster-binding NifX family protein
MKRVAIPIVNQQLSEYFGECNHYEIFEIDKKILSRQIVHTPAGIVATELPGWLEKQGVTDVIAYKVNKQIISLFASKKVNLFVGIANKNTELLIEDYLNGKLESDKKIIAEITN